MTKQLSQRANSIRVTKQGDGYDKTVFTLHSDTKRNIRISPIEHRLKSSVGYITPINDNYIVRIRNSGQFQFFGKGEQMLANAQSVSGYTYKFDAILKLAGLRWKRSSVKWIRG